MYCTALAREYNWDNVLGWDLSRHSGSRLTMTNVDHNALSLSRLPQSAPQDWKKERGNGGAPRATTSEEEPPRML
jgi:hypothetical protein